MPSLLKLSPSRTFTLYWKIIKTGEQHVDARQDIHFRNIHLSSFNSSSLHCLGNQTILGLVPWNSIKITSKKLHENTAPLEKLLRGFFIPQKPLRGIRDDI